MTPFDIHNTLFTGKILFYESEMSSTNDFARNVISKTKPIDGTVIITDAQTNGKGQGNNKWLTYDGENLTFSIIFVTSFLKAKDQFYFSSAIAVGICNALQLIRKKEQVYIKWPNDIFYGNKKIGGILIENSIMGQYLKNSIAGIGINVNQTNFDGLPFASSLKNILGESFNLNELLNEICHHIEIQFLKLSKGKFGDLLIDYNKRLYKKEQEIEIELNQLITKAKVKEVNSLGQLGLKDQNQTKYYNHGQIKWLLKKED